MTNTATLNAVMSDSGLKKAFEKLITQRGLSKTYELATVHRDERTAMQIYFAKPSQKDVNFAPKIYQEASRIFTSELNKLGKKKLAEIVKNEGQPRNFTRDELEDMSLQVRQGAEWKKFFKLAKVVLNQNLNALAAQEIPHTPEYAEHVRKKAKAEATKLAKELELEKQVDEILGLGVALATGDNKSAATISQRLSKSHKPKKGKPMQAAALLKAAKTKMAKTFGL